MRISLMTTLMGATVLLGSLTAPAIAQDFPSRPVTLVVPYPAGGGADIIARMLAESMKAQLGQPVVVTNRPGGQGTIGTAEVLRSPADGYTIVLSAVATLTVQPHRQDLPYNTPDDYEPIIKAADLPMVLAVLSSSPWKSAKEAMDFIRANPGKIRVGTPGNGSIGHLVWSKIFIICCCCIIICTCRLNDPCYSWNHYFIYKPGKHNHSWRCLCYFCRWC